MLLRLATHDSCFVADCLTDAARRGSGLTFAPQATSRRPTGRTAVLASKRNALFRFPDREGSVAQCLDSPGPDVDPRVMVSMQRETAAYTDKPTGIPVVCVDVPAPGTSSRCIPGRHLADQLVLLRGLIAQKRVDSAPARGEDLPVQASLRVGSVSQPLSRAPVFHGLRARLMFRTLRSSSTKKRASLLTSRYVSRWAKSLRTRVA